MPLVLLGAWLLLIIVAWSAYWETFFWLLILTPVTILCLALFAPKKVAYRAVGVIITVAVLILLDPLHAHFAAHAEADAAAAKAVADAAAAKAVADAAAAKAVADAAEAKVAANARRAEIAREQHERNLAWQKAHPAEYAKQKAEQRAAALRLEQQHIAAERAQIAATQRAEAQDAREARIPMHEYWTKVSVAFDELASLAEEGGDAISNGDLPSASDDFRKCSEESAFAITGVREDVPPGWDEVASTLADAADSLHTACESGIEALDSDKNSDVASAIDAINSYKSYREQATTTARELFAQAGGDPDDL
jgi:multidrug efflux pump subunit AcrA (membrane-fusion protein)